MAEFGSSSSNDTNLYNVFGIVLTLVVGILLLAIKSRTFTFMKLLMYKLRFVLKNSRLKERFPKGTAKRKTENYVKAQAYLKNEVIRSWNLKFLNIFVYTLDRYNHLFYWVFLSWFHRKKNRVILLKP